jgi:hypothetical protein
MPLAWAPPDVEEHELQQSTEAAVFVQMFESKKMHTQFH